MSHACSALFRNAGSSVRRRFKLDALHRARTLRDLQLPAGNRLESLEGRRAGTYSLRVNKQYRITFVFEGGHATEVTCEDYH
jgi:toxin HigB-1